MRRGHARSFFWNVMEETKINLEEHSLELRDTQFINLMRRRIFNVLLIANPYDAFMLEDDGRVDEKIFDEYAKLGLRYPPRFVQVASQEEAQRQLRTGEMYARYGQQ